MSNLTDWRDLYRDALLEPDPITARPRVDKAYQAVEHRLEELKNSPETLEIRELNVALYFLSLLRLAGPKEQRISTHKRMALCTGGGGAVQVKIERSDRLKDQLKPIAERRSAPQVGSWSRLLLVRLSSF
jgi:hypothetical protein